MSVSYWIFVKQSLLMIFDKKISCQARFLSLDSDNVFKVILLVL